MLTEQTKRILVLRDGVSPELAYPMLGFSFLMWIFGYIVYTAVHDLKEPIIQVCRLCGGYQIIDHNAYFVFIGLGSLFSIISLCCFRFSNKKVSTNGSES